MEAMRCLKRRLSDVVYQRMVHDAHRQAAGSGGHVGATTSSSAADPNPVVSTSEKSLPEPATHEDRAAVSPSA
jgi:transposase